MGLMSPIHYMKKLTDIQIVSTKRKQQILPNLWKSFLKDPVEWSDQEVVHREGGISLFLKVSKKLSNFIELIVLKQKSQLLRTCYKETHHKR